MTNTRSAAPRVRRASIQGLSALVLAATLTLGACGGDGGGSTGPKSNTPTGRYALRSIDGTLPGEIYHGPWFDGVARRFYNQRVVVVDSGNVELSKDYTWSMVLYAKQTLDDAHSTGVFQFEGTYEIEGSGIAFMATGANGATYGTIEGGAIGISLDIAGSERNRAYTFRK